jgi:hypothetical protein
MIIRWISLVPSNIVKLVEVPAVSAGRWLANPRNVSMSSAQAASSASRLETSRAMAASCG